MNKHSSPPATQERAQRLADMIEAALHEPAGTVTRIDIEDGDWEMICAALNRYARVAPSAGGVASRDEIIEECAKVCDARAETNEDGSYKRDVDDEAARCASDIRALKERAAPQVPSAAMSGSSASANPAGEERPEPAVAAPGASSPIEGTSTIPSSYAADARLILKAKGWKEPEKYSDTDAIKRLLLDNAATMALDPSGWDLGISKEIQPDLERIASETRRAAHADLRVASSTVEGNSETPESPQGEHASHAAGQADQRADCGRRSLSERKADGDQRSLTVGKGPAHSDGSNSAANLSPTMSATPDESNRQQFAPSSTAVAPIVELRVVLGEGYPGWMVWLRIGNQQFSIGDAHEEKDGAEWSADMLRKALTRVVPSARECSADDARDAARYRHLREQDDFAYWLLEELQRCGYHELSMWQDHLDQAIDNDIKARASDRGVQSK